VERGHSEKSEDLMPWTQKQHSLFQAAAHNPSFAAKVGIPPIKAMKMASEGIKRGPMIAAHLKPQQLKGK